jgi:hypothetical protein
MVFDLMFEGLILITGFSIYLMSVRNHLPSPTEAKLADSAQKRWENECWVKLLWQTKSSNKADLQHPAN